MEFTDQQKQVLAIARRLRPECVLAADRFGGLSLWRSDGDVWKFSGPISAFSQLEEYSILFTRGLGGDGNGRNLADLACAIKEGRVLGLDDLATAWFDAVAREHGIPITWRAPKTNTQPAELPKTLPAGTRWVSGGCHGEFIGEARLNDSSYQGRSLSMWGLGIPTDDERLIPVGWIDWSSVPAPAKDEFKVGDAVEWLWDDPRQHEKGVIVRLSGDDAMVRRTWSAYGSTIDCTIGTEDHFMRHIAQPANLTVVDGAEERREAVLRRPDPYLAHNAALAMNPDFAAWSREQGKKRGAERRFGIMGNRDKYGQLLGATWDSDDVESV